MTSSAGAWLLAFIKLGRPHFLIGGFVLYGLGAALAAAAGAAIDWPRYAWGQLAVTATQLMTHYANDFFDLEADRANRTPTRWSGGSRVLPDGVLSPVVALRAAVTLAGAAVGAALALAACVPDARLILPLAIAMLVLSWGYSAPPLRLHSQGLGELTTATVVTFLVPLFGFYLQAGEITPVILLAVLPLCGLQFSMLLAIELPDAAGDAAGGKRTLVVRHGAPFAAWLHAAVVAGSFLSLPVLLLGGVPAPVVVAAALPAPLGAWQAIRMARGAYRDPARWESLALVGVGLLIATALAELVGALLS